MAAAKPDCTGQTFNFLKVLGKGEMKLLPNGRHRQYWDLECIRCGNRISKPRGDFDRKKHPQRSCGCLPKSEIDNKRRPHDLTGKPFGTLTALEMLPDVRYEHGGAIWRCVCSCGAVVEIPAKKLLHSVKRDDWRITCGERSRHPDTGLHYPAAPTPYPPEAGAIVCKYLYWISPKGKVLDSAVEDLRMERLLRAAWIICYKRQQGEIISERQEAQTIGKYMKYTTVDVFWRRKLEEYGGFVYNEHGVKKRIGDVMTDSTSHNEAVSTEGKTQPEVTLSSRKIKRIRFNRC